MHLFLFALIAAVPPLPRTVAVEAHGFRGIDGNALFRLYADGESWLEPGKELAEQALRIVDGKARAVFKDVAPGTYGVVVVHDANNNSKLDFSWFPIPGPDEGSGVSNDAKASIGPPTWKDCRFAVPERGINIRIRLRY